MSYILSFVFICFSVLSVTAGANENNSDEAKSLQPIRLMKTYEGGEGLDELAPWPEEMQLKRVPSHRLIEWYRGKYLAAMVYEPDEGVLKFENTPYDEKVYVVHGRSILTSLDGTVFEFKAGDHFVVPTGWSGTWEFKDGYREVITFELKSLDHAMELWFNE